MGRVVRFTGPRQAEVVDYDVPEPGPGQALVQTLYSGISAGTELTAYRGSNPYLAKQWDADRRLFMTGSTSQAYPLEGWGYEEVGRVTDVGSEGDRDLVGQLVWGAWGHRSAALRPVEYLRPRTMPK